MEAYLFLLTSRAHIPKEVAIAPSVKVSQNYFIKSILKLQTD